MPRHHRKTGDFDFAIHEDEPPVPTTPFSEGSDIRDFAPREDDGDYYSELSIDDKRRGDETRLSQGVDDRIPVEATDSNMTKASTLVNGRDDASNQELPKRVESTIDSMLEELQEENSILGEKAEAHEAYSRRESSVADTHDGQTEDSMSRRDSNMTDETHEPATTEGSYSRRESNMSSGTYESGWTGTEDQSVLDHGTEDEHSVLDDERTEDTASRRDSGGSESTNGGIVRRGSKRTEALIHAAAKNIVDQIHNGRRIESINLESVIEDESFVSESKQSSARPSDVQESVAEDQSFVSESKQSSARPSEAQESVAGESVRSARPLDAHESLVDDITQQGSARLSDAHETVAEEETHPTSARASDAHESIINEDAHPGSGRPSDAHESVVEEDVHNERLSDAHEPLADESVIHHQSARNSDAHESNGADGIRESVEDEEENLVHPEDEAGASSHNENDDDVFSDHSPRSSVGSVSESDERKGSENVTQRRTPRTSDFSHYDTDQDDVFVPTVRGTPRPPFRSPSSVRAMQMSSPPASVRGGSPRSSRKTTLPTVSRLGSPSTQFSPKRTPPRFKRNTPPLVLLHATLLPLRWPWGDVLDNCQPDELSESGKGLLEAWRELQDRLGDTVCERGILLPHPQNDFEVLEERLLEAMELPLRRRARILECGHYLGPSNELTIEEDMESEDEDVFDDSRRSRSSFEKKTHWCGTCRSDIRFDSLGVGKIFRVKVYASNGLIKAGAWEACWKDMERVDVELEPIVESDIHEELVRIDAEQQRVMELQHDGEAFGEEHMEEPEASYLENETREMHDTMPSSPPEIRGTTNSSPVGDDERRMRDEERLREIYGQTPPTHPEPSTQPAPETEYVDHRTPPSPSAEAYARREERRQSHKNESLPELLIEAVKVMMQDKKNVMIAVMSVLVLFMAMRGGVSSSSVDHDPATWQTVVKENTAVPTVTVTEVPASAQETVEAVVASVSASVVASVEEEMAQESSVDPCATLSGGQGYQPQTVTEEVRVVETVTETVQETVTATPTQAAEETLAEMGDETVEEIVSATKSLGAMETEAVEEQAAGSVADIEDDIEDDLGEVVGEAVDVERDEL